MVVARQDDGLCGSSVARSVYHPDILLCTATRTRTTTMSSKGAADVDPDADFVYDYETLRIVGLSFAGLLVILSILLLTGNRIRRCGKSRHRPVGEER
ncbi:hypothetical protein AOLI_G00322890 [Acnodon oligacanthus]